MSRCKHDWPDRLKTVYLCKNCGVCSNCRDTVDNIRAENERLREAGDLLYSELRQWLATEDDTDSQAAMKKWSQLEKGDER